jgi:hypothetical protein
LNPTSERRSERRVERSFEREIWRGGEVLKLQEVKVKIVK